MTEPNTYEDITSDLAIPPGETLLDELRTRGITQVELAKTMARPQKVISQIINGKKAITAETALQLEKALEGTSAMTWLRLEAHYRLTLARLAEQVTV
ncbi:MAG: HigA family addiction module antidote protein [Chloroflexi bacterium]|nr:HigA family addiction module antidote protein [Chloroflexota bacterium]MCH8229125.1 HigA family addiction module antidote protein [Chloroflexota bacterium]